MINVDLNHWKSLKETNLHKFVFTLRLMTSWGWYHPPNCRKIREKSSECNQYHTLQVSRTTFEVVFESISSGGLSRDHYWRGGIQEIHAFRGILRISQPVFDIYSWNHFGIKILSSFCDTQQKFDYRCSRYPGYQAQSPFLAVWPFLTILGLFRAVCFGTSV